MQDLTSELELFAGKVNEVIDSSTFPDGVRPDYLSNIMRYYPAAGGKRLRPAIMLWGAAAAGGDIEKVLPAAAALEIFHNWTLVHDDIIDDDDVRRNSLTAHKVLEQALLLEDDQQAKFGINMAILAGDLMQGWAFELIDQSACSDAVKLKLARELRQYGYVKLVSGEALDVEMSCFSAGTVTEADLMAMYLGKTGALLHFAARAGWMAGRNDAAAWDDPQAVALGKFGDALAIAFQLRDDYLGIFGNIEEFGKPIGSDLQEGKATLLLLNALNNLPVDEKDELIALLGRDKYAPCDIEKARTLFEKSGSVEKLLQAVEHYSAAAQQALDELPASHAQQQLKKLTDWLINRNK